ncbi:glycoside hydrolase [Mycena maculata]|uniref:chitinase n=1 Tax=Mycena maculata TaxID=230809 RepID=A0AAD7MS79_9AGAR|nr:glycoside hydrolase [Mycena maculata]
MMISSGVFSVLAVSAVAVFAYDPTRTDNVRVSFIALRWSTLSTPGLSSWLSTGVCVLRQLSLGQSIDYYTGQNSYGATNPSNTAGWQQTISTYCQDTIINFIPIAFVDVFFGTGGLPDLNLANASAFIIADSDPVFAGTGLANCQFLTAGIEACQAAGKAVTISLGGGAGAGAVFTSDAEAVTFAGTIWDLFLGGSSSTRPFGAAVLDGVDLDIEGGSPTGFASFAAEIRSLSAGASKPYYITAAPQCPYPDAYIGSAINAVGFDAVWRVRILGSQCTAFFLLGYTTDLTCFNQDWDFSTWDNWAKTVSPNPNVKVFIGAPAAEAAANSGSYVDAATLGAIAIATRAEYSSFGGIMLWYISTPPNDRYDMQIKNLITTAGGGTTTSTSTSTSTTSTKTTTTTTSTTKTSTTTTTTTTKTSTTSTTTSTTSTVAIGNCVGVAAWVSTVAYVGGSEVTYNSDLWQSNQWSDDEVPGGVAGAWVNLGACSSLAAGTAKVVGVPATAATLTATAHATAAVSSAVKTIKAETPVETGEIRRGNSRAFKF